MPFETQLNPVDSRRNTDSVNTQASHNCFNEVWNTMQACGREAALVTVGSVTGAVQEAQKDPVGTLAKGVGTVALGTVLGAAAVAESPVIAVGAVATGAVLAGKWAFDTLNPNDPRNLERFHKIGTALETTWNHADKKSFDHSMQNFQEGMGPIALDIGIMGLGAKGVQFGARNAPAFYNQLGQVKSGPEPAYAYGTTGSNFYESGPGKFFSFEDFVLFAHKHGKVRVIRGLTGDQLDAISSKTEPPSTTPKTHGAENVVAAPVNKPAETVSDYFKDRYAKYHRK